MTVIKSLAEPSPNSNGIQLSTAHLFASNKTTFAFSSPCIKLPSAPCHRWQT